MTPHRHARDVQGRPWASCPNCPHASPGACPSRAHRRYCDYMAADPIKWGPVIAGMPAEDRPGRGLAPPTEQPLPGWRTTAASLAQSIGSVVLHAVKTGDIRADEETTTARLAVCERGEGLASDQTISGHCDRYRPSDGRCGSMEGCGCYVAVKASLAASTCPLGRWPA